MKKTISGLFSNRLQAHREQSLIKLKDSGAFQSAKRYEQDKIMEKELKEQQRAAEQLPLQTIALPPVNRLTDPWSQYRNFQTLQLGHDPRLPSNHA